MIQSLNIPTNDGECEAWLATPSGNGPWPGAIFCMDAVGPRPVLKEMAERLASRGFVVLLPNLFYRLKQAPLVSGVRLPAQPEDIPKILDQIMPLVQRFEILLALKDMGFFVEFLKKQTSVRPGRLGIFGYCMGGAMAIRTAAEYPETFAAVASFHAGGLVGPEPDSPHRLLSKLQAALYVAHADQDPHMSAEQIQEFERAGTSMGTAHQFEVYSGAQHHFTMADLPAYDANSAEKAWTRLIDLFERQLA